MNIYWHQCWGFKWIFVHMYIGQFCWHQYSPVSLFNCIYLYLCTTVFTCISVQLYLPVSLYTCIYLYLCTPVLACIFAQLYLPVFYILVFTCIFAHMYFCTPVFACIFAHLYLPVSLHTCICLYLSTPVFTYIFLLLYTDFRFTCIFVHLYLPVFLHTCPADHTVYIAPLCLCISLASLWTLHSTCGNGLPSNHCTLPLSYNSSIS